MAASSLLRQVVDYIASKPPKDSMFPLLKMLNVRAKFPPLDFATLLEPLLDSSDDFVDPILKIYLNQSKSTDIADHLVRCLVSNLNREVYQKFIVSNVEAIIDCCVENTRLSDHASKLIEHIYNRFPSKSINYEVMAKFEAPRLCSLLSTIIRKVSLQDQNPITRDYDKLYLNKVGYLSTGKTL